MATTPTPSMSSMSTDLPPTSQRYLHSPLDKTKKEIRLVRIQPDCDGKTLRLVLKIDVLAQKDDVKSGSQVDPSPQVGTEEQKSCDSVEQVRPSEAIAEEGDAGSDFIALSYAWGDETPLHAILIVDSKNTGWISIRQNLFDFLITRRDSAAPSPWFWIDQLCINQEDDQEKGHQVNQMAQLYSTASKVEVWLGPGFEGSDEAFDFMNQNIDTHWSEWPASQTQAHSSAFQSIKKLPYWSRLWIAQEVLLAHVVTIRLGSKIAPWPNAFGYIAHGDFSASLYWLYRQSNEASSLGRHWRSIVFLAMNRECTVVKDHVFAMMGLVTEPLRFYPDYSMHTQEILLTMLRSQTAYLARQSPGSYREPYSYSDYHDVERCAELWRLVLDEYDNEIDLESVRNFLLKEAHSLLRRSTYRGNFIEEQKSLRRSRYQLLFTTGVGPTLLVRLRLRWLYPDRHSMLWKYRNGKRQARVLKH